MYHELDDEVKEVDGPLHSNKCSPSAKRRLSCHLHSSGQPHVILGNPQLRPRQVHAAVLEALSIDALWAFGVFLPVSVYFNVSKQVRPALERFACPVLLHVPSPCRVCAFCKPTREVLDLC